MTGSAPLDGVRVLTVDNYEAGNYGPMLLAMHGAEVVKVELPGRGDVLRSAGPFRRGAEGARSHGELRLMRGKRSIELDVADPAGLERLHGLLAVCDVFWTNLRPASAERIGIGPDALTSAHERLVYVSLSGFGLQEAGRQGEFDGVPAFDIIVQGLAGLLHRNADPTGRPEYNGFPVSDQAASMFGVIGVLLALVRRAVTGAGGVVDIAMFDAAMALNEKALTVFGVIGVLLALVRRAVTGAGGVVDIAMFDAAMALNEKALTVFGITGEVPRPRASATSAPFGVYATGDGHAVIGVGGNPVWRRFCAAIGREDLLERADLADGSGRLEREREVLRPLIEDWAARMTTAELVEHLLRFDVPAAPLADVDALVESAHARARGAVQTLDDPLAGSTPVVMSPVRIRDAGPLQAGPPPQLGADTDDVLERWLGGPGTR